MLEEQTGSPVRFRMSHAGHTTCTKSRHTSCCLDGRKQENQHDTHHFGGRRHPRCDVPRGFDAHTRFRARLHGEQAHLPHLQWRRCRCRGPTRFRQAKYTFRLADPPHKRSWRSARRESAAHLRDFLLRSDAGAYPSRAERGQRQARRDIHCETRQGVPPAHPRAVLPHRSFGSEFIYPGEQARQLRRQRINAILATDTDAAKVVVRRRSSPWNQPEYGRADCRSTGHTGRERGVTTGWHCLAASWRSLSGPLVRTKRRSCRATASP